VAHIRNPSYLGGRDQEDLGSRPAQAIVSETPISKIPNTKKGLAVAQVGECKREFPEFKLQYYHQKKFLRMGLGHFSSFSDNSS
jgi:hypothetical protein